MEYLIKNRKTEYAIYLDGNASEIERKASLLLKSYLDMAFEMDIKLSKEKTNHSIAVRSSADKGISFIYDNDSLILEGEGEFGAYDAVIEFLNKTIEFEVYDKDLITYRKRINLPLPKKYHYVPSFRYRIGTYGWIRTNDDLKRITRIVSNDELFITGNVFHNAFDIIKYNNTDIKNDWLSKDKKQLCYSNVEMRECFLNNLKQYLNDEEKCSLTKEFMVLGMEDNLSWCDCSLCKKTTPSDAMVEFTNYIETNINATREKPIKFLLFAYYNTIKAPFKARCNDNVGVIFAPIKMSFANGFKKNIEYLEEIEKWSKTTKLLFAWTYNFYTRRNFFTYCTFNSMKNSYKALVENNALFLYDQTESYSMNQTGFAHLKAFLQQKLMWNMDYDTRALTKKFFAHYFEEYSDDMLAIFDQTNKEYRLLMKNEQKQLCVPSYESDPNVYSEIGQVLDNFSSVDDRFESFITKINNILDRLINQCKSKKYLQKRLLLESIQYKYWQILLNKRHNTNTGFNQLLSLLNEVGITHYQEGKIIGENMI